MTTLASLVLDAPIAGVVVYPNSARVTRRGAVERAAFPAAARQVELIVSGLPIGLDEDSVRAGGTGPARVLGVRVVSQARATPDEGALADLLTRLNEARALLAEINDEDETERARRSFLDTAARVGAGALARGWAVPNRNQGQIEEQGQGRDQARNQSQGDGAPGGADPAAQLVEVGDALATQIAAVHARRRVLARRREQAEDDLAVIGRLIEARRARAEPDSRAVVVELELPEDGAADDRVEVDVSYLVRSASWSSGYDARLEGERVTLTWYAMISQRTGEDWPATELLLSTARPAGGFELPELPPQFIDVFRPTQRAQRSRTGLPEAPGGGPPPGSSESGMMFAAAAMPAPAPMAAPPVPLATAQATLESAGAASTYRPPRPVAVPADGDPHRATVAVIELDAVLDHVTTPKLAAEAHLRAAVVNTSPHTLPPGKVAVFHDQEFVGSARLELIPPGGETELRLGVDDRVRVERELVRRVTGRRMVGNTRRTDVGYLITIANHAPIRARVTVRDQVPVPRHESITVRDVVTEPAADEHTELGLLTWKFDLEPGAERQITLSYRVEYPRGVSITGWGV